MPIDNVTADELKAYVTANPTFVDTIAKPVLTENKYFLRSEADEANYETVLEKKHIDKHLSQIAPQIEKVIEETTGIKKEANENYFGYNKRVLAALKTERDALNTENQTFKSKSDMTKAEREAYDQAKAEITTLNTKIKDLETSKTTEVSKAKMESDITRQMNSVSAKLLKDERPGFAKAQELITSSIFAEIADMAQKDARGQVILIKADGSPILNTDKSFTTVAQYYEQKMDEAGFVDKGKTTEGPGGSGKDKNTNLSIPGGVKTQSELMDWLRNNTMKGKSQPELMKEFDKYADKLPR